MIYSLAVCAMFVVMQFIHTRRSLLLVRHPPRDAAPLATRCQGARYLANGCLAGWAFKILGTRGKGEPDRAKSPCLGILPLTVTSPPVYEVVLLPIRLI
ncbi:hypothetical protein GGS26DRAFT_551129 [Hypomontagnella submonticulosa]|nr:hypothetical protein GGS26DRAFT_551129 [Hypomontagnella submonticulosa]